MHDERVLIAGAGPVGVVAAAHLVRAGIPVTILESGDDLSKESRASTFHPPTIDMLDQIGVAKEMIAEGLTAPKLQYRSRREGLIAQFDFRDIADQCLHPFRLQCEQWKLTHILHSRLRNDPNFTIKFGARVESVEQDDAGVKVRVCRRTGSAVCTGRWLIGADGASSEVRRSIGIEFQGFTWPERFLVLSTPFDFKAVIPDLVSVNYVADPERWHFLLQIPCVWRVMFPISADTPDETAMNPDFGQSLLAKIVPGISRYEVVHSTLYRVHQRVAKRFRIGRVFLAGDAAHINNPLGGMGMNGGIHDAVNLVSRLVPVWNGDAKDDELDRYDRQRRLIALEYVQTQSTQNKRDLESTDKASQAAFRERLRRTAADKTLTRDFLLRVSMITSLRRAEALG